MEKLDYCIQGQDHSEGSVCQWLFDDIFWTTEHFVTKLGMVVQHREPECHAEKKLFAIFKVKVTARAHMIKIWFLVW